MTYDDFPPPKPDDMSASEYAESWFDGGLCGVIFGVGLLALVAVLTAVCANGG